MEPSATPSQPEIVPASVGPRAGGGSFGAGSTGTGRSGPEPEVGEFRQGSAMSQWALARYLVGRAVAESIGRSLLGGGLLLIVLAVVLGIVGTPVLAVLLGLVGLAVLAMRGVLMALLRRLTALGQTPEAEAKLRALVRQTRGDVLRELRRIDLPGRAWSLPLLALRLARRTRRDATVQRLQHFEVDRAVPAHRLDELHLLLRDTTGRPVPPAAGWAAAR